MKKSKCKSTLETIKGYNRISTTTIKIVISYIVTIDIDIILAKLKPLKIVKNHNTKDNTNILDLLKAL